MKIVQALGWYYPDSTGGTEVYVQALGRLFRAWGHEVIVAAPDPRADPPRTYSHDAVCVFRYPIPAAPTRDEVQGLTPVRGPETFHQWLSSVRPDVVHMHTFVTGLGIDEIAAAKRAGARVIVTTHASSLGFLCQRGTLMFHGREICDGIVEPARCAECELGHRGADQVTAALLSRVPVKLGALAGLIPSRVGTALGMTELIVRSLERQREMLRLVDRFVVLTEHAAAIVTANGAPSEKIAVNRLGVSHERQCPSNNGRSLDGQVRVGYVGRFDPIKGVLDLADAMRALPKSVPVRCEFRGPANTPADRATRDEVARRCAGDRRVSVGDAVPGDEVPSLMRSFDVLCCPSRCLEGGPTSGLEAMAAGTPVIAATVGGVAEAMAGGVSGRLIPPGDVGALTAALEEIATSPDVIGRWRANLPRVRTMRDVAADYLALYAA